MPTPEIALSVSVFPELMVTNAPGLVIWIWPIVISAPNTTVFAAVTVLFQSATSPLPGTPPDQLLVRFRLLVLFALVRVAAWVVFVVMINATAAATPNRRTPRDRTKFVVFTVELGEAGMYEHYDS